MLKNSTLAFSLFLSSIFITLIPFSYKILGKSNKNSSEFDGIVKQLSELENKYNSESRDYFERDKISGRKP